MVSRSFPRESRKTAAATGSVGEAFRARCRAFAQRGYAGVRFVPTGGVKEENLAAYLKTDGVVAVGGTWIAKKDDLSAGNWTEIRDRCRTACSIVAHARG